MNRAAVLCPLIVMGLAMGTSSPIARAAQGRAGEGPRFEVASIKVNKEVVPTTVGYNGSATGVQVAALSLKRLIGMAYSAKEVVGPTWLDDLRFDISAKPPAGYEDRILPTLIRNLLIERFALTAHKGTREVQGFALRVEKGGHRLKQSTGERTYLTGRQGLIQGNRRTIGELTNSLSAMVSAPVVDQTNLTGNFDLKLEWTPQLSSASSNQPEVSIFTALREQMGLRLDRMPTTIDIVIVDSVNRMPTEN